MNIERDVLDRLDDLGLRWYVTGSWALAAYAEPRMTRDIDVVLELTPADYEWKVRLAFEDDFLVNDPIDVGGDGWAGSSIGRARPSGPHVRTEGCLGAVGHGATPVDRPPDPGPRLDHHR